MPAYFELSAPNRQVSWPTFQPFHTFRVIFFGGVRLAMWMASLAELLRLLRLRNGLLQGGSWRGTPTAPSLFLGGIPYLEGQAFPHLICIREDLQLFQRIAVDVLDLLIILSVARNWLGTGAVAVITPTRRISIAHFNDGRSSLGPRRIRRC
jgi:hypothetical protein